METVMIDTLEAQDQMLLRVLHAACQTSARADRSVHMAVLYLWKKYTMQVILKCVSQLNKEKEES
jgi:hypothetical protein